MGKDQNTEEKILGAALTVFQEKGFDGARMREIAEKAKINKGLLHYYFRTKDTLFDAVFEIAFKAMFGKVNDIVNSDLPVFEKLKLFVNAYISFLSKNSFLARFIISEICRNPNKFIQNLLKKVGKPNIEKIENQVNAEIKAGIIKPIEPKQLLMNLISLCVFPIIGRPMIQNIMDIDNKSYNEIIERRKTEVAEFIINSIKM